MAGRQTIKPPRPRRPVEKYGVCILVVICAGVWGQKEGYSLRGGIMAKRRAEFVAELGGPANSEDELSPEEQEDRHQKKIHEQFQRKLRREEQAKHHLRLQGYTISNKRRNDKVDVPEPSGPIEPTGLEAEVEFVYRRAREGDPALDLSRPLLHPADEHLLNCRRNLERDAHEGKKYWKNPRKEAQLDELVERSKLPSAGNRMLSPLLQVCRGIDDYRRKYSRENKEQYYKYLKQSEDRKKLRFWYRREAVYEGAMTLLNKTGQMANSQPNSRKIPRKFNRKWRRKMIEKYNSEGKFTSEAEIRKLGDEKDREERERFEDLQRSVDRIRQKVQSLMPYDPTLEGLSDGEGAFTGGDIVPGARIEVRKWKDRYPPEEYTPGSRGSIVKCNPSEKPLVRWDSSGIVSKAPTGFMLFFRVLTWSDIDVGSEVRALRDSARGRFEKGDLGVVVRVDYTCQSPKALVYFPLTNKSSTLSPVSSYLSIVQKGSIKREKYLRTAIETIPLKLMPTSAPSLPASKDRNISTSPGCVVYVNEDNAPEIQAVGNPKNLPKELQTTTKGLPMAVKARQEYQAIRNHRIELDQSDPLQLLKPKGKEPRVVSAEKIVENQTSFIREFYQRKDHDNIGWTNLPLFPHFYEKLTLVLAKISKRDTCPVTASDFKEIIGFAKAWKWRPDCHLGDIRIGDVMSYLVNNQDIFGGKRHKKSTHGPPEITKLLGSVIVEWMESILQGPLHTNATRTEDKVQIMLEALDAVRIQKKDTKSPEKLKLKPKKILNPNVTFAWKAYCHEMMRIPRLRKTHLWFSRNREEIERNRDLNVTVKVAERQGFTRPENVFPGHVSAFLNPTLATLLINSRLFSELEDPQASATLEERKCENLNLSFHTLWEAKIRKMLITGSRVSVSKLDQVLPRLLLGGYSNVTLGHMRGIKFENPPKCFISAYKKAAKRNFTAEERRRARDPTRRLERPSLISAADRVAKRVSWTGY
ncbi:hypothetical protein AAMO2058_000329700 [Amorphochlora amoebiformis]